MKENLEEMVKPLCEWYQANKRSLPWRENKSPYYVWLSEVMLQQTRIEAVKKYYNRFIEVLPTIRDLANVEEEKLLKLWEGLGYYNRARNLKKAAQVIMEKYEGKMPTTYSELVKLPGIGEYTAGAIASICYKEKVPAVDGNVLRVLARITASKEDVLLPETKKKMTEQLKKVIPEEADIFNEALMELGEVICLPNTLPACSKCPICHICIANKKELTDQIPVRVKKQKRRKEEKTVFLLCYQDQVAIQKRSEKGILANMYEFPNVEGILEEKEIPEVLKDWDIVLDRLYQKQNYEHTFTHIKWEMIGYSVAVKSKNEKFLWVKRDELESIYAIPTAFKPFQRMLKDIYEN